MRQVLNCRISPGAKRVDAWPEESIQIEIICYCVFGYVNYYLKEVFSQKLPFIMV
jgi:hypothetical protein